MSKFIEIQTRKLIGSFAGVGAMVEDTKGVIKISPIEKWKFFKDDKHKDVDYHLNDTRLIYRLRHDKGFPKIKALVKVPVNSAQSFSKGPNLKPSDEHNIITGQYFPSWMFCSKCKRLNHVSNWLTKWKSVVAQYNPEKMHFALDNFVPPKCGYCYEDAIKNKKTSWVELTQVGFVMTSANGEIKDFPWDKWIDIKRSGLNLKDYLDLNDYHSCCDKPNLLYIQGEREDFTGKVIQCKSCNLSQNLKGMFGLKIESGEKDYLKTVVRSSNSVYYPLLIHSLYLPVETKILDKDQQKILELFEDGMTYEDIVRFYKQYSVNDIKTFVNQSKEDAELKEIDYRKSEYDFILEHENFTKDSFVFSSQKIENVSQFGITNLVKITRLKMTTVQTGYTRQEPLDSDLFLSGDYQRIKPQYTSFDKKNTEYLCGVENFGEGIFLTFDKDFIYKKIALRKQELEKVYQNSKNTPLFKNKFDNWEHLARYTFVHTFSHLLMKELEFTCGYPTVSLNERIFLDNKDMQGILIYTVGGMEGGYGGLSSQADPVKLEYLINSAFDRASDCASDPICYHSEGQGIGEMNLSACYSCALVAENACESFNSFLDRRVIID